MIAAGYLNERRSIAHMSNKLGVRVILANEASVDAVSEAMDKRSTSSVDMFVAAAAQAVSEAGAALEYLQKHDPAGKIDGLIWRLPKIRTSNWLSELLALNIYI